MSILPQKIPYLKLKKVEATLRIAGKRMNYVSMEIIQEYGQHHEFTIHLDYDTISSKFLSNPEDQIELIGSQVFVNLRNYELDPRVYIFGGIITSVKVTGKDGKKGYIILEGKSTTVLLERGKRMDTYSDMPLYNIFKRLTDGLDRNGGLYSINDPSYMHRIPFLMQYKETDWEFLQRIAYIYGENLFYDGTNIVLGNYKELEPTTLSYDKEIIDLEFGSKLLVNNSITVHYLANQHEYHERISPDKIENSNKLLNKAEERSRLLTKQQQAKNVVDANVSSLSELDEIITKNKTRIASETVYIKGRTKTYEATIGRLITIEIPDFLSKIKQYTTKEENPKEQEGLGTYRVIKSIHRIDEKSVYHNEFEAVPASLKVMPAREPKMPVVESIVGKVNHNNDPLGQGRVLVDFDFTTQYSKTWLRVMTPSAGSSKAVSQNRGMVFIPEVGDQVMVGFEYGDTSRPYVMGSLFHGKNGTGGKENNVIKSISTSSGIQITFNDGSKSLNIKDPSGNSINLDGNGNISILAPNTISLSATDIKLNAGNSISLSAEPHKEGAGEGTIDLNALKSVAITSQTEGITLTSEETLSAESKSADVSLTASTNLSIEAKDITANGSSSLNISSGDTNIM